jgi:NADH-quinone oxidoreductase subunit G
MYAAKALLKAQEAKLFEGRQTGLDYDVSNLGAVAFNSTIAGIEEADAVLLVGTNPRWEAPLVATRLRKVAKKGGKIFAIGPEVDLAMRVEWLGDDLKILGKLPKAVTEAFAGGGAAGGDRRPGRACRRRSWRGARAGRASRPYQGRLERLQRIAHRRFANGRADPRLCTEGRHRAIEAAKPEVVLMLGADEIDPEPFADAFKVYIGHHGDKGAGVADLVLPGAAYSEKHGTYVNLEGRVQRSEKAVFPPGDCARGLDNFPRGFRPSRRAAAVRHVRPASLGDGRRASRAWRRGAAQLLGAPEAGDEGRPVAYPVGDFYQAICAPGRCNAVGRDIHGRAI